MGLHRDQITNHILPLILEYPIQKIIFFINPFTKDCIFGRDKSFAADTKISKICWFAALWFQPSKMKA
ncbi:hypothetical protein HAX54_044256 [Datura stramonium]|uniref:Uncharacterized protein n=1 Tax=Datura stramonium TaxID=4076 RepID=A0ABS8SPK8_DATST|nr:hypothetical protein [Datura stramonium]